MSLLKISEKQYWMLLIVGFIVFAIIVWFVLLAYGIINENLAANLFTSSIFMVLTVIFLSWLLDVRKRKEWSVVKNAVNYNLKLEFGLLFIELLRFSEGEIAQLSFSNEISTLKDDKEKKEKVFSKLSAVNNKQLRELNSSYTQEFFKNRDSLNSFLETKRNLGDIQIKYAEHLSPDLTIHFMNLQDLLGNLIMLHETNSSFERLKNQTPKTPESPQLTQMRELMEVGMSKLMLPLFIWSLASELYKLWNMGFEFTIY